ncbi:MAG: methylenetetrahydrofolate--tRNA-(uracil(54)-C(5))-methyltransferase (FADH(2)-oxidizing) TrmFO [Oscillospiraceae bacterium]|nr:methylenetetrahydrofolate--tRNA-(uracil(54)-C(5))-methyltransferase (FADH(2)-oxidizing) TrmFO [Oscillospiraceae bacterium]
MTPIPVLGAGLAGCEAAWQLARRGLPVMLIDMKPARKSPAHALDGFAELVCSNSLRSDRLTNAVGLLKEELRRMDSLILRAADHCRVPAGGALAVDRNQFSDYITNALREHPLVEIVCREETTLPPAPAIVATGPLTADSLAAALQARYPTLSFYDAAAPIVTLESIDESRVFRASRYGRGDDYLNCPMNEAEYDAFYEALLAADTAPIHGFEEKAVFEGCMPVESLARRGRLSLAFGPLKPVGLTDPRTGRRPFAVVQLRQDDAAGALYNLVGFQTRLTFPAQRRVFGLIPGLENAEFARYGVMHRNTFLQAPGILDASFQAIETPGLYFAGQITGVEGYVESAASGLVAGIALARQLLGLSPIIFPTTTALGALGRHVSAPNRNYQPMNIAFGLIDPLPQTIRDKARRYETISQRALAALPKEDEPCN